MRRRIVIFLAVLTALQGSRVPAQQQLSEEEKRRLFLKAREEMTTIPYSPPSTPGSSSKPKPKPRTPPPKVVPKEGTAKESTSPKEAPQKETPPPKASPAKESPPVPKVVPPPVATPVPNQGGIPLRPPEKERPPIEVRQAGVAAADEDDASKNAKEEPGFWSRLFGGGGGDFKYLTQSIRRAIDQPRVTRGRWRYIVVHNSGTRQGNAAAFEHYHRYVRKMPNGLAYHFVIGNGTSSKNGGIEIGNRWRRQLQGGHVHSDYLNNIAIGICLVGDFNNSKPTQAQLDAAEELINYLRRKVGRVGGQRAVVRPHKDINPPRWPTDCPGDRFDYRWFRRF